MHRVTCERHTLPALLRLQWCNRNECSLLWYVQCATDARLEGKTGHGQCCYEGLLALKTAVCGHVYFSFPRKVSGWTDIHQTLFQSKNALRWWGLFSCVCFSCWSAVSFCCEEQWLMGRYYHSYKKTTTVLWCLPWGPYSSCTMVFTVLPRNMLRKTQDHKDKCQKHMLLYV